MPNYWFDHVHLTSPDPARTAEFYVKVFGARPAGTRDLGNGRILTYLLLNGVRIIVARPASGAAQPGIDASHLGFRTDDLDRAAEEMKAMGVKFTRDVTIVRPGAKLSFLLAPENVSIELIQVDKLEV